MSKGSWVIATISVAVPAVVAVLLFLPTKVGIDADWVYVLPHFHAGVNTLTAVLLVLAFLAIRSKRIALHKTLMLMAVACGALFLVSYVVYHGSVDSVIFGDADHNGVLSDAERAEYGPMRAIYLAVLLSHILLSLVVLPLVLFGLFHALNGKFDKHKKVVRFGFPIWLYVSITGVLVYLMISPFYR